MRAYHQDDESLRGKRFDEPACAEKFCVARSMRATPKSAIRSRHSEMGRCARHDMHGVARNSFPAARVDAESGEMNTFSWPRVALTWDSSIGAKRLAAAMMPCSPVESARGRRLAVVQMAKPTGARDQASSTGLAQGVGSADGKQLPAGALQVSTDFGAPGWGGPCPPVGDKPHRYNFTIYALKTAKLEIAPGSTAALAGYMVNANALAKASLTATHGRAK